MNKIDKYIFDSFVQYVKDIQTNQHIYGHILLASNVALCLSDAGLTIKEPILKKIVLALERLPIYGDEDIHWEIVRAYTFSKTNFNCKELNIVCSEIGELINSRSWPKFNDLLWGLFASSIVLESPCFFSNPQKKFIIKWIEDIQEFLLKEKKTYLLSFAIFNEIKFKKLKNIDKFEVCIRYLNDLINKSINGINPTNYEKVWDNIVQIADVSRLAKQIDQKNIWKIEYKNVVDILLHFINIQDIRKRSQILKALFILRNIKSNDISDIEHLESNLTDIEKIRAKSLVKKFEYWHPITEYDLYEFLLQAPHPEIRIGLLDLLEQIKMFSTESLEIGLFNLINKYALNNKSTVFTAFGDLTGSSGLMCYGIDHLSVKCKYIILTENQIQKIPSQIKNLVIIDDCILSGTQALSIWKELLGIKSRHEEYKYIREPLSVESIKILKKLNIFHFIVISNNIAAHRINSFLDEIKININLEWVYDEPYFSKIAEEKFYNNTLFDKNMDFINPNEVPYNSPFRDGSPNWTSRSIRINTYKFLKNVGFEILEDKGFSKVRREQSALGYSNAQKLFVFYHNVPKSTLTPLWKRGIYNEIKWKPLFPERDRVIDYEDFPI